MHFKTQNAATVYLLSEERLIKHLTFKNDHDGHWSSLDYFSEKNFRSRQFNSVRDPVGSNFVEAEFCFRVNCNSTMQMH